MVDIAAVTKEEGFDLHLHTTASDGELTPLELMQYAVEKRLKTISITDHDTINGVEEAYSISHNLPIQLIRGIELSSTYKDRRIDILGYNIHPTNHLKKKLAFIYENRLDRANKMVKLLNSYGVHINMRDIRKQMVGELICRPHIAMAIVEKGYASCKNDAFRRYIGDDSPTHVPLDTMSVEEAIATIHEAGGHAVLAHPRLIKDDQLVLELLRLGLNGIEVWHRRHTSKDVKKYKRMAKKYEILQTGGSDFHTYAHYLGEFGYKR
ncbi:PHP domain-containing protein [Cytobacillus sp. FSL R7-0696]|uniref:PHP domain-containing protein n=1 Tax=Cytobacillus sp. FSL R7-0696 TaxID=2921691 RepID=UPI0030F5EF52